MDMENRLVVAKWEGGGWQYEFGVRVVILNIIVREDFTEELRKT